MVMGDEGGQMAIFEGTIPQSHPQVIPFNPADDFDREGAWSALRRPVTRKRDRAERPRAE